MTLIMNCTEKVHRRVAELADAPDSKLKLKAFVRVRFVPKSSAAKGFAEKSLLSIVRSIEVGPWMSSELGGAVKGSRIAA
jgi:hypothetical protein